MKTIIIFFSAGFLLSGCASVPYTNRQQLNLISPSEENQLGAQAYQETLSKAKLSTDQAAITMVERIGHRIASVADQPDFKWEFKLIDDPKTANAFCLPGGHVAVYTGILTITKDENGLAVVMSHEIAHAIAHHGAERMSQGTLMNLGTQALQVGMENKDPQTQQYVMSALGLGVNVGVVLPFSRGQEAEADHIGLILMAKAGYDPRSAVPFWERMKASGGQNPPEFLSTHPSDETRIQKIREELPEALQYYQQK